jgi:hypothetical protein
MMSLLKKSVISPNEKTARRNYPIMAAFNTYSSLSRITWPIRETFSLPNNYESSIFYQKRNPKTMYFLSIKTAGKGAQEIARGTWLDRPAHSPMRWRGF